MNLNAIARMGIRIRATDRDTFILSPKEKVNDAMRQYLRDNRESVLLLLRNRQKPRQGVGTELEKIIDQSPLAGIFKTEGCGCRSFARHMNSWGPDLCEERLERIVNHLEKQAKKRFGLAPFARHVATRWVKEAIENARKAGVKP